MNLRQEKVIDAKIKVIMKRFINSFFCALFCLCPHCHKPLAKITTDYGGLYEGYGHYYCPDCDNFFHY